MAEPGRMVRVSGLPTDIEHNRLKDKLLIHFLRAKNGGGEIDSVTIVKATPAYALITFEDSRVAQRVIRQSRHTLEVDEKKYKLAVTEHRERLDPDKVILSLSAMIDCSQLPGGAMALTSLQKSHPDVQINYDATVGLNTLHGAYSKVQAALTQLFGHLEDSQPAENKDSGQSASSRNRSAQVAERAHTQESEDQSRKPNKQREQREKVHSDRPPDEYSSISHRQLTPGGYGWEDTGQTEAAAAQLFEPPTTPEEDLLLIVDADMFQYVQKHCQKEYQRILSQHGVEAVDMTNQGLTSLFLQVAPGEGGVGGGQESLKLARKALSSFFQENEATIRRSHFPKSLLSPRGGLQKAKEILSIRLPKLLLNEDARNIYIIGSSSDVSEAKQFLLLDHSEERGKKEETVASLLRYPSYDSGLLTQVPLTTSSAVDSLDERIDPLLRSEEDEKRARRYKLAARFKDSGLPALGSRPTDFSLRSGLSSPSRQTRLGPLLGHDVLSETAHVGGERVSRALSQNTGGDILFKNGDALPSAASKLGKSVLNSHLTDARPKSVTSPFSTNLSSLSGNAPFPPAGSGSSLKRASSFSGTPQQKVQVTDEKSHEDSGRSTVRARGRSSSFSSQTEREKREVHISEITVSSTLWHHIKEAYNTRVDDLTSDVQMKESCSGSSGDLTVTLRGASSSKVSSCQSGLQRLVDSVSADFSVQHLYLSELGIRDAADETLQACCAEVRSRFKKVTIQISKESVFLLGPKKLCLQVGATLREVFSGDVAEIPDPSTSNSNPSTFLQRSEDQSTSPNSHPQVFGLDRTAGSQERRTNSRSDFRETELVNGSVSKPSGRREPVIKEKVNVVGRVDVDGQRTEVSSKAGHDKEHVDGDASSTHTDKDFQMKEKMTHSTPKDNTHCHKTELPPRGIQGKMSTAKIRLSIPGQKKDSAIKITYCIPDGIQEENHPSPGKPFQGGTFEAYFPDCDETRKLLPRLRKAFSQGLTFTVTEKETGARATWDCIPHKTNMHGGKAGSGYPDSTYLSRLSDVLTSHGIEESAEISGAQK